MRIPTGRLEESSEGEESVEKAGESSECEESVNKKLDSPQRQEESVRKAGGVPKK